MKRLARGLPVVLWGLVLAQRKQADPEAGRSTEGDGIAMERIGRYGGGADVGNVSAWRYLIFLCSGVICSGSCDNKRSSR